MKAQRIRQGLSLVVREDFSEAALWRQHLDDPTGAARLQIFERHTKLAKGIARDMYQSRPVNNFEIGDVEQLAMEGLLQSIDRFEPLRSVPFRSFARPRIRGNISNGLSKASEANAHFSYKYRAEKERLSSLLTDGELNDKNPIEALSKLAASLAIGMMIEAQSGDGIEEMASGEPSAYDSLVWQEMSNELKLKVDKLPSNEAFVIQHHYRNAVSFQQIAILLGLSKGRVSQLHASALGRLRTQLSKYK